MINILDLFKYGKLAWSDEKQVSTLISQAKTLEGPKPSYKTGEFWINVVLPTLAGIIGGAAAVVSAPALVPYFVIATTVLSLGAYLGRQWLKAQHLIASKALDLSDPATLAQLSSVVQTVSSAVGAIKTAASGNVEPARTITDTLNAPTTVNVTTAPAK